MNTTARDDIWFDKLTWPEVDALDRDRTILVLTTGCTEQAGPHLPIDSDNFFSTLFITEPARRAREEGIPVYLLPLIPFGPAEEHMAFPGTISLSFETHHRLVKEILHSLGRHGFRKMLVMEGCGGHHCLPAALEVRAELRQRDSNVKIWVIGQGTTYYRIAKDVFDWEPKGVHADDFATSISLARRPESVRMDKLAAGNEFDPTAFPEAWFIDEIDPRGFAGDTRRATAQLGEELLKRVHDYWLNQFRRIDRTPV
jgi:creatinine amidohydrolase